VCPQCGSTAAVHSIEELAGGSRVLPMAGLTGTLTVEQADALVARLRDG
jgi:hypothetical protein